MKYQTKARQRLQQYADKVFSQWRQSKQGKKWSGKGSPYKAGFSLPDFHHDLIRALNAGDEEQAKCLMLLHYSKS